MMIWKILAIRAWTSLLVGVSFAVVLLLVWAALADTILVHPTVPAAGDPGQFTEVDGVRTYYAVEGHGPPLLLLHGLGSSHLTWSEVRGAFADDFTVYTVDLPGFGYSDKPAGYASARQEAAFVDRFLASLGIERAAVIGHSMGGTVALWLAAEHPDRVERLVLVDVAEIGDEAAVFRLTGTPILGDLMLKSTTTPVTMRAIMSEPYVQKQALTTELSEQYARFYWTPGARQALIEHARSYDADRASLRRSLASVHAPALVVWTDADPYFPVAVGEQLRDQLPTAELRLIHNAGHLPQEEQPTAFADVVLAWLARP
jgi:pimeloyl-ACP methyl ester carboxylesterase